MKCWILSTPRTGGNYLSIILNQIDQFEKVCNGVAFEEWLSASDIYQTNDKFDMQKFTTNPPACLNLHYLRAISKFGDFNKDYIKSFVPQGKFIVLKRRDILDQAVSFYVAKATGRFRIYKEVEEHYLKQEVKIDDKLLLNSYQTISSFADGWKEFQDDQDSITVFYEDLLNYPVDTVRVILDFLHIKKVNIQEIVSNANDSYKRSYRKENQYIKERLQKLILLASYKMYL